MGEGRDADALIQQKRAPALDKIGEVKCVLIDPPDATPRSPQSEHADQTTEMHEIYPPLGLAYIAAFLRENGIHVKIIDARSLGLTCGEVVKMVENEGPDFVGMSVITPKIEVALYLSRKIKEVLPGVKIILGGPHIHFEHKEVIKNEEVDFCVRGEGELTALELINAVSGGGDLREVKGVTFKDGSDVIVTPDRSFIKDLDALPFPARDLLPNPIYRGIWTGGKSFTSMLATRGCPYSCHFCDAGAMWGRLHRRRSVGDVLDELEQIYEKFDVKCVRFVDDLLVVNKKWAIELCRGMVERGLDMIEWSCDGRVGLMSEELLREMKRANCRVIFYGIEFGNQRILDFCNKGFTIPQVRETIDATARAGISSYGYFMMGYPTETRETIEDTIALAKDLALNYGMDSAGFSIVTPFPGTPLYEYCRRNNLLRTTDWSRYSFQLGRGVINLRGVTDEELTGLYHRAHYEFFFRQQLKQFV
ncbi:MAG: B12-binding domain-containing radical SAM protein [Candidatus Bathyarchaeia archaeon]